MFDPTINSQTFQAGSFKHLRTRRGIDTGKTVTLDVATFTAGTHYANGYIPGGVVLGKVTASGKFGPYAAELNEVQRITVDATAGNWTITINGETTANIAFNATAAAVTAALALLPGVDAGDVTVTGGPGNSGGTTPYFLTFGGQFAGTNVAQVTAADVSLTGGGDAITIATTVAGGATATDGTEVADCVLLDRVPLKRIGNLLTAPALVVAAAMTEGDFVEANMPIASGTAGGITAAGKLDLGPAFRWS